MDKLTSREQEIINRKFNISKAKLLKAINGGGIFQLGKLSPTEIEAVLQLALKAKLLLK